MAGGGTGCLVGARVNLSALEGLLFGHDGQPD